MTKRLSDEEFHAQTVSEGGASRHAVTGNVPDRGYMVGGARNQQDMPFTEIKRPVDQFDVDFVRHHARSIRDHFGEQASVHQGSWVEQDQVVLDASEKVDHLQNALDVAKQRGERAIHDVKRGRDINL